MEESYQFSAPLTGFKTFFSDSCFYFYLKQSFSMDLISVSLGRPLSVTESRSSISIWAPLKVFNIHCLRSVLSTYQCVQKFHLPWIFHLKTLFYVQVYLNKFENQVLMVWHNSVLVELIL